MALIFVGPKPGSRNIAHAGGQLTATLGFAEYAARTGIVIKWIDTAQSNFPVPRARTRLVRAARRVMQFVWAIAAPANSGAILFAGAGASFVERSLMALVARMLRKPTVLMVRSGHFNSQYRSSAMFRLSAKLLLKIPRRIGVQGESWVPLLREAGVSRDRVVVVPNWLSHPAATPRVRTMRRGIPLQMLFAGWMTSSKGVPELIDAARLLAAEGNDVILTLAGGGTLLDAAHAAAREPALAGKLLVRGWLDREALAAELARADILVLPSHAEGFPNVVIEALADGIPVIATSVGAIPDSVTDGANGKLVPVGDPAAIAAAVRFYLANPDAVERHSHGALAIAAERHGRDANCNALVAALSLSPDDLAGTNR